MYERICQAPLIHGDLIDFGSLILIQIIAKGMHPVFKVKKFWILLSNFDFATSVTERFERCCFCCTGYAVPIIHVQADIIIS